jgi:hypothetical protein
MAFRYINRSSYNATSASDVTGMQKMNIVIHDMYGLLTTILALLWPRLDCTERRSGKQGLRVTLWREGNKQNEEKNVREKGIIQIKR